MKSSQITAFLGGLTFLAVAALAQSSSAPAPGRITPTTPVPPAAQTGPGAVSSSFTMRSTTNAANTNTANNTAANSNTANSNTANSNTANATTANATTAPLPGTTQTTTTRTSTSTSTTNPAGTVTNSTSSDTTPASPATNPGNPVTNPGSPQTDADQVNVDAPRFKTLDIDGDSRISRTEFTLGAAGPLQGDTNVAATGTVDNGTGVNNQLNTAEMFTQLDTNKDGFLSASELAAQLKKPMKTQ